MGAKRELLIPFIYLTNEGQYYTLGLHKNRNIYFFHFFFPYEISLVVRFWYPITLLFSFLILKFGFPFCGYHLPQPHMLLKRVSDGNNGTSPHSDPMSLSLFHSIFVVQHLHQRLLGALHTKERSKPFETNHFVPINQRSNFFGSCCATREDNRRG